MTKEKLNFILDRLDYWRSVDDKMQKAMDDFVDVVASGSYAPILETTRHEAYLEAVSNFYPELKEHLEYYLYEMSMSDGLSGTLDGKTYNFDNRDEYVEFVLDYLRKK